MYFACTLCMYFVEPI